MTILRHPLSSKMKYMKRREGRVGHFHATLTLVTASILAAMRQVRYYFVYDCKFGIPRVARPKAPLCGHIHLSNSG